MCFFCYEFYLYWLYSKQRNLEEYWNLSQWYPVLQFLYLNFCDCWQQSTLESTDAASAPWRIKTPNPRFTLKRSACAAGAQAPQTKRHIVCMWVCDDFNLTSCSAFPPCEAQMWSGGNSGLSVAHLHLSHFLSGLSDASLQPLDLKIITFRLRSQCSSSHVFSCLPHSCHI